MNKLHVSILAFVLSINLQAQEKGHTRFSLVFEPIISWMKSDDILIESDGPLAGYNFGVKIDRFFGENYAFTTGLMINTSGGKLSYPPVESNSAYSTTYRLKHIEIPLGLRLRSDDLRRINIYGRFGLSPQIKIQALGSDGSSISDEVNLFELGYHLGGGIEYSLGRKNGIILGLIFNNGFTDITKNNGFNDKTILNCLALEFGFIF
ncbi:MAG: PorT family protein [Marinilabiliaceae bacterium]|nr:PorT family protein [Marinilabiliaceae bacterium]